MTASQRRRDQLKEFLRAKREALTPAAVGMPTAGRRRTPGLRREEVAVLAGVGVSWYTWLEQGRDIKVSDAVLDAVARALTIVGSGGYAEVVTTSAELVSPLDGYDLGLGIAAALPSNSTTALLVLDRVARIEPGENVLVHAAAGGVGSQLGQAARLLGAGRVVGTVGSPAKIEKARAFGYDEVVLREQVAEAGRFDVVVDMVGGAARRTSTVSGFNLAAFSAAFPTEAGRALHRAVAAAASGELRVQVESLRLEQAAEAHRRIESGRTTGKLLLEIERM
ncbi:zinc-binding dehydrogenase [Nonomuraea sp. NPDC026600]|uniref:zinc-binding dehydrogenase n=1 Tax=Nonomuraea sp. NPDC026600 TaxID=3155363 RepID=UPI0034072C02